MHSSTHDYTSCMKVKEIACCIPSKLTHFESINKINKTKLYIAHLITRTWILETYSLQPKSTSRHPQGFYGCILYKKNKTDTKGSTSHALLMKMINMLCLFSKTLMDWARPKILQTRKNQRPKIRVPLTFYKNVISKLSIVFA